MWVVAISNDPVGANAQFCDEHGVTYPFLSDEGSAFMHRLGIVNDLIEGDDPLYGIPFPGSYLLDERGVVVQKYFHREFRVREVPAFILVDGFGIAPQLEGFPRATANASGVTLEAVLGAADLKFRQRAHVHVRIVLPPDATLVAPPEVAVAGAGLEAGPPRPGLEGGTVAEVQIVDRELETARAEVSAHVQVRTAAGVHAGHIVAVLEIPVGELNRASRG